MSENNSGTPFSHDAFLATSVEAAMSTRPMLCPPGDYTARIAELKTRALDDGRVILAVSFEVLDDAVKAATGRQKITVKRDIWLDIQDGQLETGEGKNIDLGKLRAAVGQNQSGQPWQPMMLVGTTCRISVVHEPGKNSDDIYDRVKKFAALS